MANHKPDYTLTYFFHEGYTNLAFNISNKKKQIAFSGGHWNPNRGIRLRNLSCTLSYALHQGSAGCLSRTPVCNCTYCKHKYNYISCCVLLSRFSLKTAVIYQYILTEKHLFIFNRLIKIKKYHLTMKRTKKTCNINNC